jgi:uncharacterized damage-inducible protein DinB
MADEIAVRFIAESRRYVDDYFRKIERCVVELTDEQIWWRPNEASNSIGNLLLHLSGNVRQWIVSGVGGAPDQRERQQEFDQRSLIPRDELLSRLQQTLREADDVLAKLDSSVLLETRMIQGCERVALDAVFHVVEHLAMHTGQIIWLTKMLTAKDATLTGHFWHHTLLPATRENT